jgi:DNA-binding IclR family transcriptional regulator
VQTLERGLRILKCFDVIRPEWTVKDISSATRLPAATVYRLVITLQREGFLECDSRTHRYHLGPAFLKTGYLVTSLSELARIAHPHLERLTEITSEATMLAVWRNGEALIVDAVPTPGAFSFRVLVGSTIPGLATVHGRIFAAYAPDDVREAALAAHHVRYTEYTMVDPQGLREELEYIRREGVAFGSQQTHQGMCSVDAPVFGPDGSVVASLAVAVPLERFGPAETRRCMTAVKQVAATLSRELGYRESAQ